MSSKGSDSGEKTEKATPHKLKKARREGQISNSQEVGQWLGLLAATWMLPGVFRSLMNTVAAATTQIGWIIREPDMAHAFAIMHTTVVGGLKALLPLGLVIAVIGVVGAAAQSGIYFAPKALKPKMKKLNPASGLKRILGPQAAWQGIKMLGKCAALAGAAIVAVKGAIPAIYGSGGLSVSSLIDIAVSNVLTVLRFAAIAGLVLAIADVIVVKRRNNKQLKMSKYEVKQEHKQQEGDPHFKSARMSKARQMSQNRMMAAVPDADVVMVNPTHVAVALKYVSGKGAPRVVAKGADKVAARIRALADEHRVPMVRDITLARTLYATCDIGDEIPHDLYQAVATVLAFVMTLKSKGSAAGTHRLPAAVRA